VLLENAKIHGSSQRREVDLDEIRAESFVSMTQDTSPICMILCLKSMNFSLMLLLLIFLFKI